MIDKERGITLLTLVISIVVIFIIGGIAIVTGSNTIKGAQFMKFQAELTMVQSKVNEISAEYQREGKELGCVVTDSRQALEMELKQEALEKSEEVKEVLSEKATARGTTVEELKKGLHLCTKEYLKEALGLEGLERNYMINVEETIIISLEKFEFEGKNYYMLEQIPSSLYNVNYNNQIPESGDFAIETAEIADGYQITIIPKHDQYVSKWQVKYRLKGEKNWQTEEKLVFNVSKPGTYEIQVTHGDEVNLGTKTIAIASKQVDEEGYYLKNLTINGEEKSSTYNPIIPKGFKPLEDRTTGNAVWGDGKKAPSQESVNCGLVIEGKDGSQYVWIPVDGTEIRLSRYTFDDQGKATIQESTAITIEDTTFSETESNVENFKQSVKENGGFYMAKYEASKGSNGKAISIISQTYPASDESTEIKEKMLWNWVNKETAQKACQNLYDSINSDLINSYAWDTAITFIQKNDSNNNNYANKVDGSYTLSAPGTNEDVSCNIYGMSSNCAEWTTENTSDGELTAVYRGGDCKAETQTTSSRVKSNPSDKKVNVGFRAILYF